MACAIPVSATRRAWADGYLWIGQYYDSKSHCELRRLASDGTVEETLTVPVKAIAGVEATGDGGFWCAGEQGRLRLVRRKRAS